MREVVLAMLVWALDANMASAAPAAPPARMTVITDARHPLTGMDSLRARTRIDLQVFDLSAPERVEAEIDAGLPPQRELAAQLARQRLADPQFQSRLRTAYQGHLQALQARITRIPAVLFDGTTVVYGVTDLEDALAIYLRWKGNPR